MYGLLADVVVFAHVLYVSFVVLGQLAIILGAGLNWNWSRNPWFRWLHLLTIAIVVVEAIMNWPCPLTTWEYQLRSLAGQTVTEGTFVGRLLHNLIFLNSTWTPQSLQVLHISFGVIVLQGFIMYPPRGFNRQTTQPGTLATQS